MLVRLEYVLTFSMQMWNSSSLSHPCETRRMLSQMQSERKKSWLLKFRIQKSNESISLKRIDSIRFRSKTRWGVFCHQPSVAWKLKVHKYKMVWMVVFQINGRDITRSHRLSIGEVNLRCGNCWYTCCQCLMWKQIWFFLSKWFIFQRIWIRSLRKIVLFCRISIAARWPVSRECIGKHKSIEAPVTILTLVDYYLKKR